MKQLLSSSVLVVLSSVFSRGALFVINLLAMGILSIEDYGLFAYFQSTMVGLAIIGVFGLDAVSNLLLSKRINLDRLMGLLLLGILLCISISGGITIVDALMNDFVGERLGRAASEYYSWLWIGMACTGIGLVLNGMLLGAGLILGQFKSNVVVAIALLAGGYLLLREYGLIGGVMAIVISRLLGVFLMAVALLTGRINEVHFGVAWSLMKSECIPVIRMGFPIMASAILVAPVVWLGNLWLIKTAGASQLAVYGAAFQIYSIAVFIPGSLSGFFLSYLASHGDYKKKFKICILLNGLASIGFIIAFILTPYEYFGALNKFGIEGRNVIITLLCAAFFASINAAFGQLYVARSMASLGFVFNACWAVVFLISTNFLLSYGYGSIGLAYSMLASYFMLTVIQYGFYVGLLVKKT